MNRTGQQPLLVLSLQRKKLQNHLDCNLAESGALECGFGLCGHQILHHVAAK